MKNKQKEIVAQLSDKELILNFYFTQVILLVISCIVGLFIYNDINELLNLFNFFDWRVYIVGGLAGLLVVCLDIILMRYFPDHFFDDGGINERLFQNRGVWQILFMTFVVAFTEELLFRGMIQYQFGLIIASLIFSLVHIRYLFNKLLFINVVVLSFFIGWIFYLTNNLAVTFFMHFIIDAILGLIIYFQHKFARS